jgi:hypothetical protein
LQALDAIARGAGPNQHLEQQAIAGLG